MIVNDGSYICLVVTGTMEFLNDFPDIGNVIIPTGPNSIIFQDGGEKPATSYYWYYNQLLVYIYNLIVDGYPIK